MACPRSVSSLMNFNGVGPAHNAEELRRLENHFASGCIAYVQRSSGERAALINRRPRDRASGDGALLNVSAHASVDPNGTLASEITACCACFIVRTAIPRPQIPTFRYNALTSTELAEPTSWLSAVPSLMYSSCMWVRDISPRATFMFAQG